MVPVWTVISAATRQMKNILQAKPLSPNISAKKCFWTDTSVVALVIFICHNPDPFIFLHTAEGIPREDARGSAEETGPSIGGTLCYPAHSSAITAPVLSPSSRGLSQPQQEEKEFGSGRRWQQSYYFLLYQISHKDWQFLTSVLDFHSFFVILVSWLFEW